MANKKVKKSLSKTNTKSSVKKSNSGESKTVASERKEEMNLDLGVYADGAPKDDKFAKAKQLKDKGNKDVTDGVVNQAKNAPGLAIGILTTAGTLGGGAVVGVPMIVGAAPGIIKGKYQETKGKIELAQSNSEANKVMKDINMTKEEKKAARRELAEYNKGSVKRAIKSKPEEVKKTLDDTKDALGQIAEETKKSDVHAKRVKQANSRLNIPETSSVNKGVELGE